MTTKVFVMESKVSEREGKRIRIVAVIGNSGSGKTHAVAYLAADKRFNEIVSYTTRPMRQGETNGVEHWFVQEKDMPPKEKMIAYTEFGGRKYWTVWHQFSMEKVNLYVIDEAGVDYLKEVVKEAPFPVDYLLVRIKRPDLSDIDEARKGRDQGRFLLPDSEFDFVVVNDGTIGEFEEKLSALRGRLLEHPRMMDGCHS